MTRTYRPSQADRIGRVKYVYGKAISTVACETAAMTVIGAGILAGATALDAKLFYDDASELEKSPIVSEYRDLDQESSYLGNLIFRRLGSGVYDESKLSEEDKKFIQETWRDMGPLEKRMVEIREENSREADYANTGAPGINKLEVGIFTLGALTFLSPLIVGLKRLISLEKKRDYKLTPVSRLRYSD